MSRIFTHLSYEGKLSQPALTFSDGTTLTPLGSTLSLRFDLGKRFCTGWHNLATSENHPCPNQSMTDRKYNVCPACQQRTGFNPAFYNAAKISPQQEARNAEPHHLYLAYMGENYIKVGISWHKRGINRLLDQGARAGLILDTFPTATIARQYEAKIARIASIHETTLTRTKLRLLNTPFRETLANEQLHAAKQVIETDLSTPFAGEDVLFFDNHYMRSPFSATKITPQTDPEISGSVEAIIGDILITQYEDQHLTLPLGQYIGYEVELSDKIIPLDLKPQQAQLF